MGTVQQTRSQSVRLARGDPGVENTDAVWKGLYQIGGVAALMVGAWLLFGAVDLSLMGPQADTLNGWLSLLQNNWLVVIFKLHAGFSGVQTNPLYGLNLLDIAIMALVGAVHLGLYAALRRTSKLWSIIALAQPFLGLLIFIATQQAGRSGVLGAGVVISFVMLGSHSFGKATAYGGILASILLLIGDFSEGIVHSNIIAILTGIGYLLLTTWFCLVARRLLQLGRDGHGSAK